MQSSATIVYALSVLFQTVTRLKRNLTLWTDELGNAEMDSLTMRLKLVPFKGFLELIAIIAHRAPFMNPMSYGQVSGEQMSKNPLVTY